MQPSAFRAGQTPLDPNGFEGITGMRTSIDDERYAKLLLEMGEADGSKLASADSRGSDVSVALWMAEELTQQSHQLSLDSPLADKLRRRAEEIKKRAAAARHHHGDGGHGV